jgi:hypothetical protein
LGESLKRMRVIWWAISTMACVVILAPSALATTERVRLFEDAIDDLEWDPGYVGPKYSFSDITGGVLQFDPANDSVAFQIEVIDSSSLEHRPQNEGFLCRLYSRFYNADGAAAAGQLNLYWGWQSPGREWVNASWTPGGTASGTKEIPVTFGMTATRPGIYSWYFEREALLKLGFKIGQPGALCSQYEFRVNVQEVPLPGQGGRDRASGDQSADLRDFRPANVTDTGSDEFPHNANGQTTESRPADTDTPSVRFAGIVVAGAVAAFVSWRRRQ